MLVTFAGFLTSCAIQGRPEPSLCTSRFDCAPDERCDRRGFCVEEDAPSSGPTSDPGTPAASIESQRTPTRVGADAGTLTRTGNATVDAAFADDASTSESADASLIGPNALDGGTGTETMPEPGCPAPAISVRGGSSYCTIAQALAAAGSEGEIDVPAGTYSETLDITSAVTIRGAGSDSVAGTVLQRPAGAAVAIALRGSGVVLENLAIDANGAAGLEVTGSATLADVRVTGAVGTGLRVLGSNALVTSTRLEVRDVALELTTETGSGVDVRSGASLTLIDSDIVNNAYEGAFVESATLVLSQSRITGNGRSRCGSGPQHCRDGLAAVAGSSITIMDTDITESGACGILVLNSSITMRHSSSSSNGARNDIDRDGLLLVDTQSATIEGNFFENNWGYGMFCVNATAQCPASNTRRNNGFSGTNCQGC